MFGNPVPGRILPKKEPWTASSGLFRQVRTFQDHLDAGDAPGNDFGNGTEGAEVYAAAAGKIVAAFVDPGNGAIIVRVEHPLLAASFGGRRVVTGYAHIQKVEVGLLAVAKGQLIGHVGSTGAPGQPHLHWGVNLGGQEVDGWPLLDQNELPDSATGGSNLPIIESLQGLPDGASIQFVKGKPYQMFGYDANGGRWSAAWTPTAATSAGTEAIVKVTGEPASYFLPKSYDGKVVRPNVYLPTNYVDMAKGELYIPPAADATAAYNAGVVAAAAKATEAKK